MILTDPVARRGRPQKRRAEEERVKAFTFLPDKPMLGIGRQRRQGLHMVLQFVGANHDALAVRP